MLYTQTTKVRLIPIIRYINPLKFEPQISQVHSRTVHIL